MWQNMNSTLHLHLVPGIKETLIVICQYFSKAASLVLSLEQHLFSYIKILLL